MERGNIEGFVGCSVVLHVSGDKYEGVVVKVSKETLQISVTDVQLTEKDKSPVKIVGVLNFFGNEIDEIKFLDEEMVNRRVESEFKFFPLFRRNAVGQDIPTDEEILKMGHGEKTRFQVPEIDTSEWPTHINLNEINDAFLNSIQRLQKEQIIAISAIGVRLCRFGTLCFVTIFLPSSSLVFLYDICALGAAAFEKGLKFVLEDPNIVKILHDGRFISDCVFHQYNVKLQNVFDTQAAHIVAFKQSHGGDLPRYYSSLPKTLQDVLSVDVDRQFPVVWYRADNLERDQSVWKERPLSRHMENHLIASVLYLPELRLALIEKMMAEFRTAVDINLHEVCEQSEANVYRILNAPDLLPGAYMRLNEKASARRLEADKTSTICELTEEKLFGRSCDSDVEAD